MNEWVRIVAKLIQTTVCLRYKYINRALKYTNAATPIIPVVTSINIQLLSGLDGWIGKPNRCGVVWVKYR